MVDRTDQADPRRLRGTYGARRIHTELTLGSGLVVAHGTVEMLIQRQGLRGLPGSRRPVPQVPTAADLVDRDFHRHAPNRLWVAYITEHPTRKGKVYCCVVLDAYSRRVVGWSIDSVQIPTLVTNALGVAVQNRRPENLRGMTFYLRLTSALFARIQVESPRKTSAPRRRG